jgi:hypothetical protein
LEGGGFGVRGPTARGLPSLSSLNDRPIESGEKGAIVSNDGIMSEERGKGGLVKDVRSRYHSMGLLL